MRVHFLLYFDIYINTLLLYKDFIYPLPLFVLIKSAEKGTTGENKGNTGMTDFIKHEFCEEGEKIYVKEGGKVFRLEFENAFNTYRGFLVEGDEAPSMGKFTSKTPKALVGFEDISVGSDPVYLGISSKSVQFGKPAEKKNKKTPQPLLVKPPPPSNTKDKKKMLMAILEEEEEEEEKSTDDDDEEYEEDEDYSCGGSPKKKKVHVISDSEGEDTIEETPRPELKRSKTISNVKIDFDDEDTVPYIGSPPTILARETDASYSLSPPGTEEIQPTAVTTVAAPAEAEIFPSPPPSQQQ
jgi:hypothetical protein